MLDLMRNLELHLVKLTETSPLSQLLSIRDLDERDVVLSAEGDHELLVGLLFACLVQHAHVGLATVEGLAGFAETTGETVVDQGDLQDTLEGVKDGHAAGVAGLGRDLDLIGGDDFLGGLFSVRLRRALGQCVVLWECVLMCVPLRMRLAMDAAMRIGVEGMEDPDGDGGLVHR